MQTDRSPSHGSTARAVRHHLPLVVVMLVLGAIAGWMYGGSAPTTYTSSTRVLVNPSVGNPFSPTPASVRQDQQTSLETEAQVARSEEVLHPVAAASPTLTTAQLVRGVRVSVLGSTQVLEFSYTARDKVVARQVANAVAAAYLANRQERFDSVTAERIDKVETQTLRVVDDLRAATAAAQVGSKAKRDFNTQLAAALRNELVSLRAQRTALENSESPPGAVISPASPAVAAGAMLGMVAPIGMALVGLAVGCVLALGLERLRGAVRSGSEVEAAGLQVLAAVPHLAPGKLRTAGAEDFLAAVRRLRGRVMELTPRPEIIAIAPAGERRSEGVVPEALAESLARAGLRVVLVRTEGTASARSLAIENDGLSEALLYERLNVVELLQPSIEPLLSLLPAGRVVDQSRELLSPERLRSVLAPLVEAGHLVVVESPGSDTVEGEAILGAADLGLVVVDLGRTRPRDLASVATRLWRRGTTFAAVLVERGGGRTRMAPPAPKPAADRVPVPHLAGHDLGEQPLQVPPVKGIR
jgi:capsular polysaccharide biosynthesis protein